jgi:hypothetical protein
MYIKSGRGSTHTVFELEMDKIYIINWERCRLSQLRMEKNHEIGNGGEFVRWDWRLYGKLCLAGST